MTKFLFYITEVSKVFYYLWCMRGMTRGYAFEQVVVGSY